MGNHDSPYGDPNSSLARQYNQLKSKQALMKLQSNNKGHSSYQHNTFD